MKWAEKQTNKLSDLTCTAPATAVPLPPHPNDPQGSPGDSRRPAPHPPSRLPALSAVCLPRSGLLYLVRRLKKATHGGAPTRWVYPLTCHPDCCPPPLYILHSFLHQFISGSPAPSAADLALFHPAAALAAEVTRLSGRGRQAGERAGAVAAGFWPELALWVRSTGKRRALFYTPI
jgi:hypothetical protein